MNPNPMPATRRPNDGSLAAPVSSSRAASASRRTSRVGKAPIRIRPGSERPEASNLPFITTIQSSRSKPRNTGAASTSSIRPARRECLGWLPNQASATTRMRFAAR